MFNPKGYPQRGEVVTGWKRILIIHFPCWEVPGGIYLTHEADTVSSHLTNKPLLVRQLKNIHTFIGIVSTKLLVKIVANLFVKEQPRHLCKVLDLLIYMRHDKKEGNGMPITWDTPGIVGMLVRKRLERKGRKTFAVFLRQRRDS